MDWTDSYNKNKLANSAENIIKELITEIHLIKLPVHSKYNLTLNELNMLYRWPLYVGINIFIERLVRTLYDRDRGLETRYNGRNYEPVYFNNIESACIAYYNDDSLNAQLLNNLTKVLLENIDLELKVINLQYTKGETNKSGISKRQYTLKSGVRFLKRKLINVYLSLTRIYLRSPIAFEDSKWLNLIFPIKDRIIELPYKHLPADSKAREKIRKCCKKVFLNNTGLYDEKIDDNKKQKLSILFANYIDYILPLSVLEGLLGRFNYYDKILRNRKIKQVHSPIGYNYNDNYKCFAILAKRKNAKLIGHEHGVANFHKYMHDRKDPGNMYKGFSELLFHDYYLVWGDPRRNPSDVWHGVEREHDIKIINNGSVYLKNLKKWENFNNKKKEIILFYISGPLRPFMNNLQEMTTEKNFAYRKNVLGMLEKLLRNHSNLKILYKKFMGIDLSNDPITEILSEYFHQGRVQLTNGPTIKLMPKVDIAFFDMISTGFAEAIQIGIPTLVFSNEFYYEAASDEGKKINDELEDCGVVFYNTKSGIRSFEKVVNDLPGFQRASKEPIRRFQEAIAYPVTKNEFKQKIKNIENYPN